jgi:hypothetical protein
MILAALRDVVARLNLSAGALIGLGVALDARTCGKPIEPALQPRLDAVLDALGVRQLIEGLSPAELQPVLAEIRLTILQGRKLLFAATRASGWSYTDRGILQAAGDTSSRFAAVLEQVIVPRLPGLAERLENSGSLLDVGVGVAGFAIAVARRWPSLRVVGVDPWAPALVLAHENVCAAGLTERIELRQQAGEDIPDEEAFDLAWVPSAFLPDGSIAAIVDRVYRALRPAG